MEEGTKRLIIKSHHQGDMSKFKIKVLQNSSNFKKIVVNLRKILSAELIKRGMLEEINPETDKAKK